MNDLYEKIAQEYAAKHKKQNEQQETQSVDVTKSSDESVIVSDTAKGVAMAQIVSNPRNAIGAKISGVIGEKIDNDADVNKKVAQAADEIINDGIEEQKAKARAYNVRGSNNEDEALYEKHKNEYMYHGIDHKVDAKWKTKILCVMSDIWFVIFSLLSFFTIVPISIFMERIKALHGLVKWAYGVIGILLVFGLLFSIILLILHFCGINIF